MADKFSFTALQISKVKLQMCLVNSLIHLKQYKTNFGMNGLMHVKPMRIAEKEVELRTNGAQQPNGMSIQI